MSDKRLVHLVDDEEPVRRSTSFVLKSSGFDVVSYASPTAFLKEVKHAEPGCILLDVRMPDMDGLQVQRTLCERGIAMPVIFFTGHGDISIAVRAMKQGAFDFIEKPFEKAALLASLEAAFDQLHDGSKRASSAAEAAVRIAALTARERDVLAGLARGHPNKTIGYDLGISPRTVEVHRANLMQKLQVHSLSDALRIAFAAGIAEGDE